MLTDKWTKPSEKYCVGGLGCPEVRLNGAQVEIRDQDCGGQIAGISPEGWRALCRGIIAGEFDLPK